MSTVRDRRLVLVVAWVAGILITLFVAVAAVVALPPALANLASETADGDTSYPVESDGRDAEVRVPAGWIVVRHGDDAITVRTPDGALSARIEVADGAEPPVSDDEDVASPVRTETLSSGASVAHVDLADGTVLAEVEAAGATVRVRADVSDATTPEEAAPYRPAIGELLEAIE